MKIYVGSLAKRKSMHKFLRSKCKSLGTLETFWNKPAVEGAIKLLPNVPLMCDSVAGDSVVLVREDGKIGAKYVAAIFEAGVDEVD